MGKRRTYLCTFFRVPDGPGDIPREGLLRVDHEGAPAGVVPGEAGDHSWKRVAKSEIYVGPFVPQGKPEHVRTHPAQLLRDVRAQGRAKEGNGL